jgi:phospholipid/cholesterol/gamma-HCH transport system substrate-binding protein
VRLNASADKLDRLMAELLTFTETLNSGQGSLGRLMTDPELYDNVKRTVANIERLTAEARPVLENAKIFTDKIARHPESIGLRGMVKPSDGTKW